MEIPKLITRRFCSAQFLGAFFNFSPFMFSRRTPPHNVILITNNEGDEFGLVVARPLSPHTSHDVPLACPDKTHSLQFVFAILSRPYRYERTGGVVEDKRVTVNDDVRIYIRVSVHSHRNYLHCNYITYHFTLP